MATKPWNPSVKALARFMHDPSGSTLTASAKSRGGEKRKTLHFCWSFFVRCSHEGEKQISACAAFQSDQR
jgi:hypothetical protein